MNDTSTDRPRNRSQSNRFPFWSESSSRGIAVPISGSFASSTSNPALSPYSRSTPSIHVRPRSTTSVARIRSPGVRDAMDDGGSASSSIVMASMKPGMALWANVTRPDGASSATTLPVNSCRSTEWVGVVGAEQPKAERAPAAAIAAATNALRITVYSPFQSPRTGTRPDGPYPKTVVPGPGLFELRRNQFPVAESYRPTVWALSLFQSPTIGIQPAPAGP